MFHVKQYMIKGVILDFNGTMYLDHDLNRKAWVDAFNNVRPKGSNAQYSELDRNGIINDYSFSKAIYTFFNIEASDAILNNLSEQKEIEYRQLAKDLHRDKLIEGVETLLNYLKKNNIPFCIASMAPKSNMDFYLDYLHLDRWFNYDNIVYDNGQYFDKNSQIIEAARRMKVDVKDCLIFEDTPHNISLAIEKLKTNKIIYVNTRDKEYISKAIIQEIKDYTELDYKIFNN